MLKKFNRKTKLYIRSMIFSIMLLFAAFCFSSSGAYAAIKDHGNMYAIVVSTGVSSGEDISMFVVDYLDLDGVQRSQYIFPNEDDFQVGMDEAASFGLPSAELNKLRDYYSYTRASWDGASKSMNKPLQQYSSDTFLVKFNYKVSKIKSIQIVTNVGTKSSGAWTCQGFRIYKVDSLRGLGILGYYSDNYYARYNGTLLAKANFPTGSYNFTWTNDSIFIIDSSNDGINKGYKLDNSNFSQEESKFVSDADNNVAIKTTFADKYKAGIETYSLSKKGSPKLQPLSESRYCESMVYRITYVDKFGATLNVNVPMYLSSLGGLYNSSMKDARVAGYAQQGDDIVSFATLPNVEKITEIEAIYDPVDINNANSNLMHGLTPSTSAIGTNPSDYINLFQEDKDDISILGISVYDNPTVDYQYENSTVIRPEISDSPIAYYAAQSVEGTLMEVGTRTKIKLKQCTNGTNPQFAVDNSSKYLVKLKTADMPTAGTTSDINLSLEYMTTSNVKKTVNVTNLREACRDYYGFWPTTDGKEDIAYYLSVKSSEELNVVFNIEDLDYFCGATFSLGSSSKKDDWQLAGLSIYKIKALSKRKAKSESVAAGSISSDRKYYRDCEFSDVDSATSSDASKDIDKEKNCIFSNQKLDIYLQNGDSRTLEFNSESVIVNEDDYNIGEKYSMTYDEALSDFGFTKARSNYVVDVKVSNSVTGNETDDSGSKNYFYFQLVFQNGKSGYVLANQQLEADGFRAGTRETFSISTNHDYGNLESINIIPDDTSQKSDVFDKLNIENIKVSKSGTNGINHTWNVNDIGWVGIDYRDEGESNNSSYQGRSESEVVHNYPVATSKSGIDLLFCVTTDKYGPLDKVDNTFSNMPFSGSLTALITYTDKQNNIQTQSVNVVDAMYKYYNQDPIVDSKGKICSNPDYMFRSNHNDRFKVEMSDVSTIDSIRFDASSDHECYLNISNVSVSLITSDGPLKINSNDEFVHDAKTLDICSNDASIVLPISMHCLASSTDSKTLYFERGKNAVPNDMESGDWPYIVPREPISKNDSLDIYVVMSDKSDTPKAGYSMKTTVRYTNAYGQTYSTGKNLSYNTVKTSGATKTILYAKGLGVSGVSTIDTVALDCTVTENVKPVTNVDYAIIQQVRSGVIINTYKVLYLDASPVPVQLSNQPQLMSNDESEQVVSIGLGAETTAVELEPTRYDMAVAFSYTTTTDPVDYGNSVYNTKYVYITDQQYEDICAGKTIDIVFNQPFVKEIKSVSLISTGGVDVSVDKICAGVYTKKKNTKGEIVKKCTNWYSFLPETSIKIPNDFVSFSKPVEGIDDEASVIPIEMTFKTSDVENDIECGTNAPIRAKIGYVDKLGAEGVLEIENLRNYLVSGDFGTGHEATVKILTKYIKEIKYVELTPHDAAVTTDENWKLETIKIKYGAGDNPVDINRKLDVNIGPTGYTLYISKVSIDVSAKTVNPKTNVESTASSSGDVRSIAVEEAGQKVDFLINMAGINSVFKVKAEKVVNSAFVDVSSKLTVDSVTKKITFIPDDNDTDSIITYKVTVYLESNPDIKAEITVEVAPNSSKPEGGGESGGSDNPENTEDPEDSEDSEEP